MKKQKKHFHFLFLLFLLAVFVSNSQTSTNGIFDTIHDRLGNKFSLGDISLDNPNPFGRPAPTLSCSSGYFELYFAPNSLFSTSVASRTLLCQLMSDISDFVISPLSNFTNTVRVKIYCSDLPGGSGANALSTSFYMFPTGISNSNPGIIDNQAQKTIISGIDAYSNLPIIFPGANGFYHCYIQANPNAIWNYDATSTSIASNEVDFYTIMLHEVTHALGFSSMIGANGTSLFGASNNYYARYDQFLYDSNGNPLIQPLSPSCPNSSVSFVASTTAIATATSGCITNSTTCGSAVQYSSALTNVKVYTPNCFSMGSSLSHFEDMCPIPNSPTLGCATSTNSNSNNDLYFVMSNQAQTGTCYQKRYLRPEEKSVLCDLGYSVNSVYGNIVAGSNFTYASSCAGPGIWGANDGLSGGIFTFTASATVTNAIAIPISSSITSNDSPNTSSISCLELLYNNATVSQSSGSVIITTAVNYSGLVVLKYYPVSSFGAVGSAVYIFAYFFAPSCSPNSCDLVYNGGFEQNSGDCGGGIAFSWNPSLIIPRIACWQEQGVSSPDYYSRTCSLTANSATVFDLGTNVLNISPTIDSHSGAPSNNAIIGQWSGNIGNSESFITSLTAPITPSTAYVLDFWALNPANYIGNPNQPVVISVNSLLNSASIVQTPIGNFTLFPSTVWSHFTYTFVSGAAVNHNAINIIANEPATAAIAGPTATIYYFYDDISIKPLPTVTFTIPNASTCGPKSFTNLAQFASLVPGIFTGTGVTTQGSGTNTVYQFNIASSLTTGVYPIAYTYTNGTCVNTLWESIVIGPTVSINMSGTNYCQNTSIPATITALASSTSTTFYTWQPGNLIGSTQIVTPSISTVFTVSAITNSCVAEGTLAVNVSTTCCTNTVNTFPGSVFSSTTYTGSQVINNTISIPSGTSTVLQGEFMFAPNSKIIVYPGANLYINNSHLYACGTAMWGGIEILNGGYVSLDPGNLIEDAVTAINAVDQFTSSSIISVIESIFNKNHVDINISKANCSGGSPLLVKGSVFTCRNIPFTSTNWPSTDMSSSAAGVNAELRYTTGTATAGLNSPYLNQTGFTIATLKSPFTSEISHTAIVLSDVGVTTNTAFYGVTIGAIGGTPPSGDFNLFDVHGTFINSTNSNLTLLNNVFQNTQKFVGTVGAGTAVIGGAAVNSTNNLFNSILTISSSSLITGNRFWNCHTALKAENLLRLYFKNCLVRSVQTTTNLSGQQGERGLVLGTNRYQYFITNNEFTNIANCINIPLASGLYSTTASGTINGMYSDRIIVQNNVFSGSGSSNYINNAVNITCANFVAPAIAGEFTVDPYPYPRGIVVESNKMEEVFRAVNIAGIHSVRTSVASNSISLKDDNLFGGAQRAISVSNTYGHAYVNFEQIISGNTITALSTTNTSQGLVFCGNNLGVMSPSVTCNNVSNCYQGFVFAGMNGFANFPLRGALWLGNKMQSHKRGMTLLNFGVIKQQGDANEGMGNRWNGTWAGGSNPDYGIYTSISTASDSPLWYDGSNGSSIPLNLSGFPVPSSYAGGGTYPTGVSSEYGCSSQANHLTNQNDPVYPSDNVEYIFTLGQFQSLKYNDSLRTNNAELGDFYSSLSGTSCDKFENAASSLYSGDYANARSYLSSITESNDVEGNYLDYYTIHANLLEALANSGSLSPEDSAALYNLAQLCPEDAGSCVYLARALYNRIYNIQITGSECEQEDEGKASVAPSETKIADRLLELESKIKVYPVPTKNMITIEMLGSNTFNKIEIHDLVDRCVFSKLITSTNSATIDVDLPSGCYILRVITNNNSYFLRKVIISK